MAFETMKKNSGESMKLIKEWDEGLHFLMNPQDDDLERSNPPRTRITHPYSYDPFTIWGGKNRKCNNSVYTDRMSQWDYKKFEETGLKVFGDKGSLGWFNTGNGKKVEQFLRKYNGDNSLELTRIVEYCNVSNGYPVWRLDYYKPKTVEKSK